MSRSTDPDAPIFLVGFMGSGKTTVGRLLARRLGWSFADLDDRIVSAAGMPIQELFARQGEAAFRAREMDVLRSAAAERRTVLATGGGAACRAENLALMLGAGRVVALGVSPAEAVRRAGPASGRPLLDGAPESDGGRGGLAGRARAFLWAGPPSGGNERAASRTDRRTDRHLAR